MRGQIIRRSKNKKSDSWSLILSEKDPDTGKYKKEWITFHGKREEAEQELTRILRERDTGTFIKPGKITLGEYLDKWVKEYAWPNLAPRTAEGYQSIIDVHLKPALGKIHLSQIRPQHIQSYYSDKLKSNCINRKKLISPSTVRHHAMCLHSALDTAVTWHLLSWNPAAGATPPPKNQPEMKIMNEDDINTFLEAAKKTRHYVLFFTDIYTGMRRSEILALRWSDVDLLYCTISINRSIHRLKDKSIVYRKPKTPKSRRLIALTPSNALILKEHLEARKRTLKSIDPDFDPQKDFNQEELVFNDGEGNPLIPDYVSQAFARLADRLGLNDCTLHGARHSHASLMLKQGIHPKIVQERLGHSSIQITLDTYSTVLPGLQEAAAKRFDELLTRKPEPVEV